MISAELYYKCSSEIDRAHAVDLNKELENGQLFPAELLYSKRMLEMLELMNPQSSNELKLAVQCQHLKRWGIPRGDFPYDRRGYHQWRRAVMDFQLAQTKELLAEAGVEEVDLGHILNVLKNQGNKQEHESQLVMDTACLVFLKWYMEPFATKHESEKVADILKKTMRKMTGTAINLIPDIELPASAKLLLEQAIG